MAEGTALIWRLRLKNRTRVRIPHPVSRCALTIVTAHDLSGQSVGSLRMAEIPEQLVPFAEAGYSGEVTVGFQFWSKSGLLCGTKDDPGGKPGLLVARATK